MYECVLGRGAITRLPAAVAALHDGVGPVRAVGAMQVDRGSGWLPRLLAAVGRLPRPGAHVRAQLDISRGAAAERWTRRFGEGRRGGRVVRSRQTAGDDGRLLERVGLLEFAFALDATEEGLRFRQRGCRLRLIGLVVALPAALAPRVDAVAGPAAHGGVAVSVRVGLGGLGQLVAYEGTVWVQEVGS